MSDKPKREKNERWSIRHLMIEDGCKYTTALRKFEVMSDEEKAELLADALEHRGFKV